jgi:hypothetical protein
VVVPFALVLTAIPSLVLAAGLGWGLRGGWTGSHLEGTFGNEIGPDLRHDVTLGAFARMEVFPGLSFQPELAWVTKGGQGDFRLTVVGGGQTTTIDYHVKSHYTWIEVPLLLHYELPIGGVNPYLVLGPAPAWSVGDGEAELDDLSISSTGPRPARSTAQIFEDLGTLDNPKLSTKAVDLGLATGIGVRFGRGPARFSLEARYTHGLLDVHPSDSGEIRNRVFAVTTAVQIR